MEHVSDILQRDFCKLCLGPMVWTMARGVRYVACARECQPSLPGLEPPPLYAKGEEFDAVHWRELSGGEGVIPLVSGAATERYDDD